MGVGEESDLRLAVMSRAGVHVGGHSGALGLGWSSEGQSNAPWANGVGPMLFGGGVHLVSCVSLSAIKSCGEPAPAFTSSPVPLSITAEPGRHSVFSGHSAWLTRCVCALSG